jgi:hypothetical protein
MKAYMVFDIHGDGNSTWPHAFFFDLKDAVLNASGGTMSAGEVLFTETDWDVIGKAKISPRFGNNQIQEIEIV